MPSLDALRDEIDRAVTAYVAQSRAEDGDSPGLPGPWVVAVGSQSIDDDGETIHTIEPVGQPGWVTKGLLLSTQELLRAEYQERE
ncbi:hypothetical protein Srot_0056 [Segniliparus rotundus DSM 44985]|uniref:Uncharacterized protein n=1 Tax=Segniliparus rotundus (strain ATCC BAA-972 / CDC 1076 / CIP 108378 / DSM 44985 / JCM 13578) TaxID=640132 RepID=D6Z9M2_SEGRD|nr:hypothetical protein [Segniliparus rotundus]ADG96549.1 hypothetical protein Srot_0056 [Segniliparus rotundus DSM 44985]